ncbi:MAG: beta-N-acetylhexosaminidase [Proteobacteria bacterium]|nr:MAG: beta-N-acetylhexosaminidase [Pseudomonadota bacterium]
MNRRISKGIERRCGELIIGGFDGLEPPREILRRIARGRLGGVVLFARNIAEVAQVRELCRELRAAQPTASPPLLIAIDQEGGRVQRIRAPLPAWPPMALLGVIDDITLTQRVGRAIGGDLRALGLNVDFAPVLDVVDNPTNTVIGDRSFGHDPELVGQHGVALAKGLGEAGILACGKHFPGHGGPVADSHYRLPSDRRAFSCLKREDLRPFADAVRTNVCMLMAAHVAYPAITGNDEPATFSEKICRILLREVMGFRGVLCSDDLEMGAITEHGSVAEAGLRAVKAGIDLLLVCHQRDQQEALRERLIRALKVDAAVRSRLERSLERVDRLRAQASANENGPLPPLTESLRCYDELRTRLSAC